MTYKLIGIRPNHKEMRNMIGKCLFRIVDGWLEKCYITDIKIGKNDKWQFVLATDKPLTDQEPLFISPKSAKRYAKQHNIQLH